MKQTPAVFFALWPQYVLLMLVRQISDCLPIVDGALVVVDCAEGLTEEFCQFFRQAMTQRLRPVLFLNKLDKLLSLEGDDELCYQRLMQIVDSWLEISQDVAQIVLGHRLCHVWSLCFAWYGRSKATSCGSWKQLECKRVRSNLDSGVHLRIGWTTSSKSLALDN